MRILYAINRINRPSNHYRRCYTMIIGTFVASCVSYRAAVATEANISRRCFEKY